MLLAALAFGGCTHKAKRVAAPDATALRTARAQATRHLTAATQHEARAHAAITAAAKSHQRAASAHAAEVALLGQLAPTVADLAMRVTVELRPEVEELGRKVEELNLHASATGEAQSALGVEILEARSAITDARSESGAALTATKAVEEKYGPDYEAKVAQLVAQANTSERGWQDESEQRAELQKQIWSHRILGGLGIASLAFLAFLKFTGRLAVTAAGVAAKIS